MVSLFTSRGLGMVEDGSGLRTSLGRIGALGWPGVADAPDWTLRVVGFTGQSSW